ncbi:MAG: universal stress protein [Gemmatimonadaceae bacterium]
MIRRSMHSAISQDPTLSVTQKPDSAHHHAEGKGHGPVMLATSGLNAPHVAAAMARRAANAWGVPLKVISVVEPSVAGDWLMGVTPIPVVVREDYTGERTQQVRKFLSHTVLAMEPYELTVRYGPTVPEIALLAQETDAKLIVVGAAPHMSRHQLRTGDVAVHLLRTANCPVVSVLPPVNDGFERVVAAVDFSPASIRAARVALSLMQERGTFVLLHVRAPNPYLTVNELEAFALAATDEKEKLDRLCAAFSKFAPAGIELKTECVVGDPEYSILDYTQKTNAQLVTVGTHGAGVLERLFIGSVAEAVFRSAMCSVLGAGIPHTVESFDMQLVMSGNATSMDDELWSRCLADFSKRNMGRLARLEVDDHGLGAQTQASGYEFYGAMYDARARCLTIMLDASTNVRDHLSRSITGASRITIKQNAARKDTALIIQSGASKSILSFRDDD